MIYTVTFNPSLDYIVSADNFRLGQVNRSTKEIMFPGGKGINVSIVLNNLGMESKVLGFSAGFTGQEIRRLIAKLGLQDEMLDIEDGFSRINVKLRSNEETELNGMGPDISEADIKRLYMQLDKLQSGDILVLAGSIPVSMPTHIYCDIMKFLEGRGVMIVVDANRDLLMKAVECRPFLIKPNHHELGEIFGVVLEDNGDVIKYAKLLQEKGARNVIVSMAEKGAVMVTENGEVYECNAPKGEVVNSVGAGDSMVAGFLYGYLMQQDYNIAFKYGVCAGSASAFSDNFGTKDEIMALYSDIK